MKKKLLTLSVLCSLSVMGEVCAADNVYVDLSVLDTVPQDSIGFVSSQPLFPEYKKPSAPKKVVAKKAQSQKKVKAQKPVIIKPEPVKPVFEPVEEEPKVEIVETSQDVVETQPEETPVVLNSEIPTVEANVTEDPTPVTEEQSMAETEKQAEVETEVVAEPLAVEPEPVTETIPEPVVEPVSENVGEPVVQVIEPEEPQNKEMPLPKEIYSLSFYPDSAELMPESQAKLEELVNIFDSERKKKIAIKAYNYEEGIDSFRRKRISLNRATEVRSYFLNKGFKDFSIKIINTSSENEYRDTVDVEELD